jgi:hypothetical protein
MHSGLDWFRLVLLQLLFGLLLGLSCAEGHCQLVHSVLNRH